METGWERGAFVGRERELAVLREAMAAAQGGVVLISGPPGIGKSSLVREVLAGVAGVRRGQCLDEEGVPPLWPWLRALGSLDLAEEDLDPSARFRQLVALADGLFADAADAGGLIVVIEDLHDADDVSLALLRQVALEAGESRLLVIATHRNAAGPRAASLGRTLAAVARGQGTRTISLAPFTPAEVARYLAADSELALSVHERTGGLPLLVSALARALDGPADLRLLVAGMLAGLDPDAQELVTVAAVLGAEVDPELLADVAELPLDTVTRQLSALADAGLLSEPPRYRFAHALVREGVVAGSAPIAPALHRRAAGSLERRLGADPVHAARIAAHWQRAGDDPEAAHATVRWKRVAAAHAQRALAPEEAVRLLTEALNTLSGGQALDPQAKAGAVPGERAEVLIELAAAEQRAGLVQQSAAHCRAAADAADDAGRPDLLTASALVIGGVGDPAVVVIAAGLCDRALAALVPGNPASSLDRARLHARKASLEIEAGRSADPLGASTEALRLAEECGDPAALLDATRARVGVLDRPDGVAERRRLGELTVRTGLRTGQSMAAVRGHLWCIDAAYQLVDLAVADEEIARLGELAGRLRFPAIRWYHLRVTAARAALSGQFAEAREHNEAAWELADRMGDPVAAVVTSIVGNLLALVRGDQRELPAGQRAAFAAVPRIPVLGAAQALALHLAGGQDEARARYEHLRVLLRDLPPGVRGLGVLQHLTELALAFTDTEAVTWAYAHWLPWSAAGGLPGNADSFCGGSSARVVGRLAAALGRDDEAVAALRTAVEVNVRLDARPWLVHTWLDLADVLRRRAGAGDRTEAASLAERAAAEARRLDLPGPLARADLLLDRLAARRRTDDPLTAREYEVAGLVAQALSNRQIADRLVLSERTVESHVRHVLAKLGLTNRTELTAHLLGDRGPEQIDGASRRRR